MKTQCRLRRPMAAVVLLLILVGCASAQPAATPAPGASPAPPLSATPARPEGASSLTADQRASLGSLSRLDDYPLYTMRYQGSYRDTATRPISPTVSWLVRPPGWGCSLFAALGEPDDKVFGRSFDWEFSPALLLFADPPDGYASVSMVDIAYLVDGDALARDLDQQPLEARRPLLAAPFIPFDGMNERGLVVGMAAVPAGDVTPQPGQMTVGSLEIIRQVLDYAASVDEALLILQRYHIDMSGGPPLHYLLADRLGQSVLVEFYQGAVRVLRNEEPWHLATNFLVASATRTTGGRCWRYDRISERLNERQGRLVPSEAMNLLSEVAQENTQWSVVYGLTTGDVQVVMGRAFDRLHAVALDLTAPAP